MKYMVVIEKGKTGFRAHVPDLPGCIAVSKTGGESCSDTSVQDQTLSTLINRHRDSQHKYFLNHTCPL
jgi:hypothetical protein